MSSFEQIKLGSPHAPAFVFFFFIKMGGRAALDSRREGETLQLQMSPHIITKEDSHSSFSSVLSDQIPPLALNVALISEH